jgi:glyoxylase-like metal-dependent hydrolase (beta-lactamase superfamily II)
MENLVTVTIRSTHYYLIDAGQGKLMVDAGWAGSLPALKSQLRRYDIDLPEIRFVMITHHHPDHAGLTQEIKQATNARLIILDKQIPFLENLKAFYAGKDIYEPIRIEAGDLVLKSSNRAVLNRIGVLGEIIETPDTATTAFRWSWTAAWLLLATCTCQILCRTRRARQPARAGKSC